MSKSHILVIPYPAQGHVIPLMELVHRLVKGGIKVTFINTEFIHKRVLNALSKSDITRDLINLVSLPDGMEPDDDRNDLARLSEAVYRVMPGKLEEFIQNINATDSDKVTCILADECMGWAFKVAENMKIKRAAFWPAPAALLATIVSIPKLIDDKIIDKDGAIMNKEMYQLSPSMPKLNPEDFAWACIGDREMQSFLFHMTSTSAEYLKLADRIICNSSDELEPGTFSQFPNFVPVGPLMASNRLAKQVGHFWPEDSTCLTWLDEQKANSVIYVAFGSFTVFDQTQFEELALGLELTNRPFLWVVRPDIIRGTENTYPLGFKERIANRGRIVNWAPQQKVVSHPSIACFLSHCGWNSAMEGLSNGLPFLCWPYFADQPLNKSYICDVWKIGLGFDKDKRGLVTQTEIKRKVEHLLSEASFKANSMNLKEKTTMCNAEGAPSNKNLSQFIEWIKFSSSS